MSNNCDKYADEKRSMLELVFAPCSPEAGASFIWIAKTDAEIIDATMKELERLFPVTACSLSPHETEEDY
jgi:15-cis-phytoene desaturase